MNGYITSEIDSLKSRIYQLEKKIDILMSQLHTIYNINQIPIPPQLNLIPRTQDPFPPFNIPYTTS